MRMVRLSDVATINPGTDIGGLNREASVSFLAMADISEEGTLLSVQSRTLSEVSRGYTPFRRGDAIVAKITPCFENGKSALLDELPSVIGFGSTEFHVVRPGSDLHGRFLHYLLRSVQFREKGRRRMTGSAGQKRVPQAYLDEFEFSLPSLAEQRRIAALLDKADTVRRKRREAIKLADEFLRSAFLDLFGDPVANPKGWPKDSFGNLGTLDRGKSRHRPRDEPTLYGGPHPFIQTGDVANCDGVVRRYTQTYSEFGLSQSRKWPAGTLAITIAANIGKTGVLGFDACFPDSVVGFTAKPPVSAEFIQFWLGQIQNRLEETAPQSAQKNINLEILRDLPVPVPPEDLLKKFTALVLRTRESKQRQEALLKESDLLFGSIQQRAFNGELAIA